MGEQIFVVKMRVMKVVAGDYENSIGGYLIEKLLLFS